jgi:hypothetical protein
VGGAGGPGAPHIVVRPTLGDGDHTSPVCYSVCVLVLACDAASPPTEGERIEKVGLAKECRGEGRTSPNVQNLRLTRGHGLHQMFAEQRVGGSGDHVQEFLPSEQDELQV